MRTYNLPDQIYVDEEELEIDAGSKQEDNNLLLVKALEVIKEKYGFSISAFNYEFDKNPETNEILGINIWEIDWNIEE